VKCDDTPRAAPSCSVDDARTEFPAVITSCRDVAPTVAARVDATDSQWAFRPGVTRSVLGQGSINRSWVTARGEQLDPESRGHWVRGQ